MEKIIGYHPQQQNHIVQRQRNNSAYLQSQKPMIHIQAQNYQTNHVHNRQLNLSLNVKINQIRSVSPNLQVEQLIQYPPQSPISQKIQIPRMMPVEAQTRHLRMNSQYSTQQTQQKTPIKCTQLSQNNDNYKQKYEEEVQRREKLEKELKSLKEEQEKTEDENGKKSQQINEKINQISNLQIQYHAKCKENGELLKQIEELLQKQKNIDNHQKSVEMFSSNDSEEYFIQQQIRKLQTRQNSIISSKNKEKKHQQKKSQTFEELLSQQNFQCFREMEEQDYQTHNNSQQSTSIQQRSSNETVDKKKLNFEKLVKKIQSIEDSQEDQIFKTETNNNRQRHTPRIQTTDYSIDEQDEINGFGTSNNDSEFSFKSRMMSQNNPQSNPQSNRSSFEKQSQFEASKLQNQDINKENINSQNNQKTKFKKFAFETQNVSKIHDLPQYQVFFNKKDNTINKMQIR